MTIGGHIGRPSRPPPPENDDSPVAARLGANRAILFSDERGTLEKFRPYGQPSDAWLDWLRQTLSPATATDHAGADDIDLWMVS